MLLGHWPFGCPHCSSDVEVDIVPVEVDTVLIPFVVRMVVVLDMGDRSFGDLGKVTVILERVVGMVEGFEDPLVST